MGFGNIVDTGFWGILLCLFFVFMGVISPIIIVGLIGLTLFAYYLRG